MPPKSDKFSIFACRSVPTKNGGKGDDDVGHHVGDSGDGMGEMYSTPSITTTGASPQMQGSTTAATSTSSSVGGSTSSTSAASPIPYSSTSPDSMRRDSNNNSGGMMGASSSSQQQQSSMMRTSSEVLLGASMTSSLNVSTGTHQQTMSIDSGVKSPLVDMRSPLTTTSSSASPTTTTPSTATGATAGTAPAHPPAATTVAPTPQKPERKKPPYTEHIEANLTPHVRLIRRVMTATGAEQMFVRKIVGDPDRARRELEHLHAQCRHPNVLKYVSGTKHRDGTVDIDMEYADAGQLDKVLGGVAPRDRIAAAKCCARQVLCGLLYYHEVHGRCHRDVKPANFLLRCDGIVKVSDFDVSRELSGGGKPGSDITVRGTGPYMSPELVVGAPNLSPVKCDVWSVGVTLFQLLEGKLPFEKFRFSSFMAPTQKHVEQLSWDLVTDKPLEHLMRRCLEVDDSKRPTLAEATAMTFCLLNNGEELGRIAAQKTPGGDIWAQGAAPESDKNVQVAKSMNVVLSDEVVTKNRVVAASASGSSSSSSDDVDAKVKNVAEALQKELRSWREVRSNPQARDTVDKAMKEVVRSRCESTWSVLAEVAKLPKP